MWMRKFGTLSDKQIDQFVQVLGIPNYLGCIAKNQLPSHRVYGWYIVNLQSENEGDGRGTHWVYVGVQPPFATYFDSFGQPMPEVVARFLVGLRVFENHEIYQSLSSHMCGWFCLYLAYQQFKLRRTFVDIVSGFNSRYPSHNDSILKSYFLKLL